MDDETRTKMEAATRKLETLLRGFSTPEMMQALASRHIVELNEEAAEADETRFSAAQQRFLLDMFLATPEPSEPVPVQSEHFDELKRLLAIVLHAYGLMYFTFKPQPGEETDRDWVAMQAFLHFHTNRTVLMNTTQVRDKVRRYLEPMSDVLAGPLGFTGADVGSVCDAVGAVTEKSLTETAELIGRIQTLRKEVHDRGTREHWNAARWAAEVETSGIRDIVARLQSTLDDQFTVRRADFVAGMGEPAGRVFDFLSIARGTATMPKYLTDAGPSETHPLVLVGRDTAAYASFHSVCFGALAALDGWLNASEAKDRYLRSRDRVLEEDVFALFERLVGSEGHVWENVAEDVDGQFEHDVVVAIGRTCIVVEAKASTAREPFRDPEKAYVRVRDSFRSKSGIQGAFDQGMRVWSRWSRGEDVPLYAEDKSLVVTVSKKSFDSVLLVCATRENFGPIGVDLDPLLQREDAAPFPWVVCLDDLDTLVRSWAHLKLGVTDFVEFLADRVTLHGRVWCSDELEVVGAYLRHGPFALGETAKTRWNLDPSYARIFDDIFRAEQRGETVTVTRSPRIETDLREALRESFREERPVPVFHRGERVGPNEPCPCGSGRKFKKCCSSA